MSKNFFAPKRLTLIILSFLLFSATHFAQVGINTTTPGNGSLLDINSADKGFLIPRVALTNINDVTTITPSATIGLLVYNTVTSGMLPIQVTPGLYYWNGSQWLRFYNRGYGIKFDQSAPVTANTTTTVYTPITGLNTGIINIPYSGTYLVKVEVAYAAGNLVGTVEGVGQASVSLTMSTNGGAAARVKETYVTSTSKRINSVTYNSLPQNISMIYTVDLDVLDQYQFVVEGREWSRNNVAAGQFGKNTTAYTGNLGVANAQNGSLTLTLVKQQ